MCMHCWCARADMHVGRSIESEEKQKRKKKWKSLFFKMFLSTKRDDKAVSVPFASPESPPYFSILSRAPHRSLGDKFWDLKIYNFVFGCIYLQLCFLRPIDVLINYKLLFIMVLCMMNIKVLINLHSASALIYIVS